MGIQGSSEFTRVGRDCLKELSQLQSERSSMTRSEHDFAVARKTEPIRNWHRKVVFNDEYNRHKNSHPSHSPTVMGARPPSTTIGNSQEIRNSHTQIRLGINAGVSSDQEVVMLTPSRPPSSAPSFRRPHVTQPSEGSTQAQPTSLSQTSSVENAMIVSSTSGASLSAKVMGNEYDDDDFEDVDSVIKTKTHDALTVG